MDEEKRKNKRIKKNLTIKYRRDAENWDVTNTEDISESGIRIHTMKAFVNNDEISLLIKVPFRPFYWIKAKGIVLESQHLVTQVYVCRIQFVDLKEEDRKLIRTFIEWNLVNKGGQNGLSRSRKT